jgi:hypothetical protein
MKVEFEVSTIENLCTNVEPAKTQLTILFTGESDEIEKAKKEMYKMFDKLKLNNSC